jgi:hypothetical protein
MCVTVILQNLYDRVDRSDVNLSVHHNIDIAVIIDISTFNRIG